MLIHEYIRIGCPDAKQLHEEIKNYCNTKSEIQLNDNLLYFGDRLLVLKALKRFDIVRTRNICGIVQNIE